MKETEDIEDANGDNAPTVWTVLALVLDGIVSIAFIIALFRLVF